MYVKFKHCYRRYFFNFDVNIFNVFRNKNERRRVVRSTRFCTCYICEFLKHIVRICFLRENFKKFVKKQLIKKKRNEKTKNKKIKIMRLQSKTIISIIKFRILNKIILTKKNSSFFQKK